MPLFGSSNTHNNQNNLTATEMDNAGYGNTHGTHGVGTTHESHRANDPLAPGTGTGVGGMGGAPMNGGGRHHAPETAGMHNDGMAGQGQQYGAGAGAGVPPTGALSSEHHQQQPHSGGGAMTGKVERTVGTIVGSKTLKAKGLQKEEEARGMKVQSQELAEAENLEREAGLRRERAVAHGAHPDNKHVGGVVPGGGGPGAYN